MILSIKCTIKLDIHQSNKANGKKIITVVSLVKAWKSFRNAFYPLLRMCVIVIFVR